MKCPTCGYEFKTETDRKDAIYWCPECGTRQRAGKVSVPKSDGRTPTADSGLRQACDALLAAEARRQEHQKHAQYAVICGVCGHEPHAEGCAVLLARAALVATRSTDADAGLRQAVEQALHWTETDRKNGRLSEDAAHIRRETFTAALARGTDADAGLVEKLVAVVEELLPYAKRDVAVIDAKSAGSLYPNIRAAMLDRARAALAAARGA